MLRHFVASQVHKMDTETICWYDQLTEKFRYYDSITPGTWKLSNKSDVPTSVSKSSMISMVWSTGQRLYNEYLTLARKQNLSSADVYRLQELEFALDRQRELLVEVNCTGVLPNGVYRYYQWHPAQLRINGRR